MQIHEKWHVKSPPWNNSAARVSEGSSPPHFTLARSEQLAHTPWIPKNLNELSKPILWNKLPLKFGTGNIHWNWLTRYGTTQTSIRSNGIRTNITSSALCTSSQQFHDHGQLTRTYQPITHFVPLSMSSLSTLLKPDFNNKPPIRSLLLEEDVELTGGEA